MLKGNEVLFGYILFYFFGVYIEIEIRWKGFYLMGIMGFILFKVKRNFVFVFNSNVE